MSKEIIILGVSIVASSTTVNGLGWFAITTGAKPQASGSLWSGASAAENTAIQNGTVLEETFSFIFPTGLAVASIKAYLNAYWTARNAQIAGVGPNQFNGVFFDSVTGWSA